MPGHKSRYDLITAKLMALDDHIISDVIELQSGSKTRGATHNLICIYSFRDLEPQMVTSDYDSRYVEYLLYCGKSLETLFVRKPSELLSLLPTNHCFDCIS